MADEIEWEPKHRRLGLVGRLGCLPMLAVVLVSAIVLVVAWRMISSPTLFHVPPGGMAWPNAIPTTEPGPLPTEQPLTETPTQSPQAARYEAEEAYVWLGEIESEHDGFSGSGFVNYNNSAESFVQWTFEVPASGKVTLRLRYANGADSNRPMDILVNGQPDGGGLPFESTGDWSDWKVETVEVNLNAGPNIIRATSTGSEGGPNLDYLEIRY